MTRCVNISITGSAVTEERTGTVDIYAFSVNSLEKTFKKSITCYEGWQVEVSYSICKVSFFLHFKTRLIHPERIDSIFNIKREIQHSKN